MADIWRPKSLMYSEYLWIPVRFDEEGCLILPFPANAIRQMVVDKPRSLQMGIANGRAEELESLFSCLCSWHLIREMIPESHSMTEND